MFSKQNMLAEDSRRPQNLPIISGGIRLGKISPVEVKLSPLSLVVISLMIFIAHAWKIFSKPKTHAIYSHSSCPGSSYSVFSFASHNASHGLTSPTQSYLSQRTATSRMDLNSRMDGIFLNWQCAMRKRIRSASPLSSLKSICLCCVSSSPPSLLASFGKGGFKNLFQTGLPRERLRNSLTR